MWQANFNLGSLAVGVRSRVLLGGRVRVWAEIARRLISTQALGDELETLRKKLRLEDATAEGVFKDAVKGVLQAPYTAASSALKLQNTPGALASLERLMDVRRGLSLIHI